MKTDKTLSEPYSASKDPFFIRMEEIWAGQRARGHVPRTEEEVEGERRLLREESNRDVPLPENDLVDGEDHCDSLKAS
jgi:hypothetical protein